MSERYEPFVLYATFTPKAGKYNELLQATLESSQALDEQPGLLNYQVITPQKGEKPIVVVAHWRSKEDFTTALKSDRMQEVHSKPNMQILHELMSDTSAEFYSVEKLWHS
jgi:heme-degrading monooxygenase HmoA